MGHFNRDFFFHLDPPPFLAKLDAWVGEVTRILTRCATTVSRGVGSGLPESIVGLAESFDMTPEEIGRILLWRAFESEQARAEAELRISNLVSVFSRVRDFTLYHGRRAGLPAAELLQAVRGLEAFVKKLGCHTSRQTEDQVLALLSQVKEAWSGLGSLSAIAAADAGCAKTTPAAPVNGKPGAPGYPPEVRAYALKLRAENPRLTAPEIRSRCLDKFGHKYDEHDMVPDVDNFARSLRRWWKRGRS
jgi:hypothetical protein